MNQDDHKGPFDLVDRALIWGQCFVLAVVAVIVVLVVYS